MNDGINKIPQLVDLVHRCKTAVVKLDSKCIVDNKRDKTDDRRVMDSFKHSGKKNYLSNLQVVFR